MVCFQKGNCTRTSFQASIINNGNVHVNHVPYMWSSWHDMKTKKYMLCTLARDVLDSTIY